MEIFKENQNNLLENTSFHLLPFRYEVAAETDELNMHDYFIDNRNVIFGQSIYLLHETTLSEESSVDFIGFTEDGAVLLIEVKRGADTRNRQEVISQLGKYAMDSFAIHNLIQDEDSLIEQIQQPQLKNNQIDSKTITRIKNNIQQHNFNLFLLTEEATDEVLASSYYLSYGSKNQKITVIELKRFTLNEEQYCSIRFYNRQPLSNSSRQPKEDLQTKLDRIEDSALRSNIEEQVKKWYQRGWTIDPLTVSTPEYFTFQTQEGKSIWAFYYVQDSTRKNLKGIVKNNSIVFHIFPEQKEEYQDIINWVFRQRNNYALECDNKGTARDYTLYCINVSDYKIEDLDLVFDKLHVIALKKNMGEL